MSEAPATPARAEEDGLAAFGYKQELKRSLTLKDLLIYGMVFMVPTAPFAIFGTVFNASRGMVPLTYLIGWVAMLFTALSYRELSRAFPVAGSVYAYAGRALGPAWGFLAGWAMLLDYLLIPTLLYVIGAEAMANVVPAVPGWAWVVAFVAFNCAVNLRGIETTARANKLFLYVQLAVLAVFMALAVRAIARGVDGAHWSWTPLYNPAAFTPALVFNALSIAVLSFLGFDAISTLSEEARGGSRVVGRATLLALLLVASLFMAQTWLAALLRPGQLAFAGQAVENDAFYLVAQQVGGHPFRIVVALTVAISTAVGNALVAQAATSRLLFSMARDGKLPRPLAQVHPQRRVPQRAVVLVAGVSVVLGVFFVGQIGLLSSLVNFGALFAFLLLHLSVASHFLLRERGRRWGMHLAVPAIGFAIIGYVLVNADRYAKLGGLAWLGLGALVLLGLRLAGKPARLELDERAPPEA
ncbi:APC family permease [Frateuria defendens]|uniref:APC family permease n=1 Tax=Frateuria defendens TaxID=2219559 RepID=UPI00066FF854|nr:APC family permease [Frateuria defendens]